MDACMCYLCISDVQFPVNDRHLTGQCFRPGALANLDLLQTVVSV